MQLQMAVLVSCHLLQNISFPIICQTVVNNWAKMVWAELVSGLACVQSQTPKQWAELTSFLRYRTSISKFMYFKIQDGNLTREKSSYRKVVFYERDLCLVIRCKIKFYIMIYQCICQTSFSNYRCETLERVHSPLVHSLPIEGRMMDGLGRHVTTSVCSTNIAWQLPDAILFISYGGSPD
jgi:hypothetical protein